MLIPYEKLEKMAGDLGITPFPMKAPFGTYKDGKYIQEYSSANEPLVNEYNILHPITAIAGWRLE